MRRPRWPELRAGLIAAAIALGLVDGCPLPPAGEEAPWQKSYVAALRPVQQAVLAPVAWLPRALRFTQRWALFQVGPRDRFRLEVEGRVGSVWTPLYRAGDRERAAYADLLEHRRVQGVWNPTDRPPAGYVRFAPWFTALVLADRPELDAVRIRYERIVVEQGRITATGERVFAYTRARGPR